MSEQAYNFEQSVKGVHRRFRKFLAAEISLQRLNLPKGSLGVNYLYNAKVCSTGRFKAGSGPLEGREYSIEKPVFFSKNEPGLMLRLDTGAKPIVRIRDRLFDQYVNGFK